jgi:c-di-GMP-binding flagellar brake protein YcgR
MADLFFVNQTVELQALVGGQTRVIVGMIKEVRSDHLLVEPVTETELSTTLAEGNPTDLFWVRPDALYSMPTEVVKSQIRPVTRLLLRRDDSRVNRIQRRQYFRINVRVKIVYRWEGNRDTPREQLDKTTYTRDISAGGVLLQLDERFRHRDRLWLEIYLPDNQGPLTTYGRVIRVRGVSTAQGMSYYTGVEYFDLPEEARSRLTRFLFKLQARDRV